MWRHSANARRGLRALLAGDRQVTGAVLNITAAAWTAGFQWWHSGDITRTQNVSEYMLVLALCLVKAKFHYAISSQTGPKLVADLLARACWLLAS